MANLIPQEKITEIQHAIDIVQIISEYVQLKQQGRNFTGLCPFHSEKTPSFMVNPEKKLFKCFGCGEGGTVFNFVMKQEGLGFVESVKLVASKAHIDITHLLTQSSSVSDTEKAGLVKIHDFVAKVYHKFLIDSKEGTVAREYLEQRKINEQSIKNFCLGYAPSGWDTLIKIGKDRSISTAQMEKTGLILPGKEKEHYYDRFRNRLMFPIVDARKRVIGFGGRMLDNSHPKYLNSPETVLFNKSSVLYGIDVAKASIMKQRRAILMEGYTDVIMAHQHGIDWSVAVMGTAISKQHLRCLRQYCQEVVLLLDADAAGWKSSDRSLDIFVEEEFDVKIAQLPAGYDPCDYLVAEGADKFLGHVNNAKDFFRFKVEMAKSKWDMATVNGRANAINDVLSTAMKMPDIIKRNLLIKMIAEEMSVDEAALRDQFKKINQRPVHTGNKKPPPVEQRFDASSMAERELLYLMLSCNEVIPRIVAEIGLEEFDNKDFLAIAEKVVGLYNKNTSVKGEDVLHALEDLRLNKLLMDVVTGKEFQNVTNHSERLEACIHYFKMRNSKKDVCQAKKRTLENVKVGSREEDIVALLDELHKKHRDRHALKGKA